MLQIQNPPVVQLGTEKLHDLSLKFQDAYTEYQKYNHLRELKIVNSISNIYIELTRAYTADVNLEKLNSPHHWYILENLENLINTHFYTEKLLIFYASHTRRQNSDEQFYPINCGNDGMFVLLTPKQLDFVNRNYPIDNEHPTTMSNWKSRNGI